MHRAASPFAPAQRAERVLCASNTKIFTTGTALSEFGPDYRIETRVLADGKVDRQGVLHGDLYLQGGGDPVLGSPAFYDAFLGGLGTDLYSLGRRIAARADIKAVTGRLYADDTIFDRLRGVADSGYATSPYIGPLSGLAFNSGFSDLAWGQLFLGTRLDWQPPSSVATLRGAGVSIRPDVALAEADPDDTRAIAAVESPQLDPDRQLDRRLLEQLLRRDAAEARRRPLRSGRHDRVRGRRGRALRPRQGVGDPLGRRLRTDPRQSRLTPPGRPLPGRDAQLLRQGRVHRRPRARRPGGHRRRPNGRDRRLRALPGEDRDPDRGQQPLRLLLSSAAGR